MSAWLALVLAIHPLQPVLDAAKPGEVVRLGGGRWDGPAVIRVPLHLIGGGATLDGGGSGTVLTLAADDVRVEDLHLLHSGRSVDALDAAVRVTGARAQVRHVTAHDVLFGIFVEGADDVLVCGSTLHSTDDEPGLRGDGIRIWNGARARVEGNELAGVRDLSIANSADGVVRGNFVHHGRFGAQLVFSPRTLVEGNVFEDNLSGVALLYSNDATLRGNRLAHSMGVSGVCITFKDSGRGLVEDNEVIHCAVGARLNAPTTPDATVSFRDNRFAHNTVAMDFYGENGGHVLTGNQFVRNLVQVTGSGPMSARGQVWDGNAWDDYQGFDRNGDGVGDTPHELYAFTDSIFMEFPRATFFRNSPALELLDFLERLAPFSNPELTLRDPHPVLKPPSTSTRARFAPSCPPDR